MSDGVTIIITTYRRNRTLRILLNSISNQRHEFPVDVVVVNNWPQRKLRPGHISPTGRALLSTPNVTVLNCSKNLGCAFRYAVAGFSRQRTILFLDDDLELLSATFVSDMKNCLDSLGSNDILSCWCANFVPPNPDYFNTSSFSFQDDIHELTEVDLVGPGISMFQRDLLTPEIAHIPEEYRDVDNVWFSLVPPRVSGSKKYYFPSSEMIRFTSDGKYPMFKRPDMPKKKQDATRILCSHGYSPLFERQGSETPIDITTAKKD